MQKSTEDGAGTVRSEGIDDDDDDDDDDSTGSDYTTGTKLRKVNEDGGIYLSKLIDGVSREPLCRNDVIEYTRAVFVVGSVPPERATVLSVTRDSEHPIVLSSDYVLPLSHLVRRVFVSTESGMVSHDGVYRPLQEFKLQEGDTGETAVTHGDVFMSRAAQAV